MWSTQDAFKETIRDSAEEYRYAASLSVNDHTERIQQAIDRFKGELEKNQSYYLRISKELKEMESHQNVQNQFLLDSGMQRVTDINKFMKRIQTEYKSHIDNLNQQNLLLEQNQQLLVNRVEVLDDKVTMVEEQMGYKHVYDRMNEDQTAIEYDMNLQL